MAWKWLPGGRFELVPDQVIGRFPGSCMPVGYPSVVLWSRSATSLGWEHPFTGRVTRNRTRVPDRRAIIGQVLELPRASGTMFVALRPGSSSSWVISYVR